MDTKAQFEFNRRSFDNQYSFVRAGHRCCTAVPNDIQLERVASELRSFREQGQRAFNSATINVQFIHIVNGNQGKISEQQRVNQMQVLNDAYGAHNIRFEYDPSSVMEVDNAAWFGMGHRSQAERAAKNALHIDPELNLNLYTGNLQGGLLGWATFPFDLAGDPAMDGVVLLHSSLPGGQALPYNLGDTAVHEVGHWLGLYHTFEPKGTCSLINDAVDDTPNHAYPDYGTPPSGSTCDPNQASSPVKNFMNYTDDAWMDHFTPGQAERMLDQIGMYRSGLIAPDPEPDPVSTELKLQAVVSGNLTGTDAERIYSIHLPADATVSLDGPGGVDFDLYMMRGHAPTESEYDDRSYSDGPDENLQIPVATPGLYYLMARSYSGAGAFTMTVKLD